MGLRRPRVQVQGRGANDLRSRDKNDIKSIAWSSDGTVPPSPPISENISQFQYLAARASPVVRPVCVARSRPATCTFDDGTMCIDGFCSRWTRCALAPPFRGAEGARESRPRNSEARGRGRAPPPRGDRPAGIARRVNPDLMGIDPHRSARQRWLGDCGYSREWGWRRVTGSLRSRTAISGLPGGAAMFDHR